ncbi:alkaline phosphatase D family protein [Nonomuraea sp. K274]|uniref:Alkaline phosphatase D family protein n=1 Tax=Nonomuraea cypriaca TaxID=1187855 RepID=A0A931ALN9_9ACTN|nr:alkaline phosphatase D family protein [Nonomuraea cypriaca]MBF8192505.1 alkaline phosphatase D family protein [Nonomuraea cypriaca]
MADPFTLGVASGEPLPDGVMLWTRLAADPLSDDPRRPGGMAQRAVEVRWQLAEDDRFTRGVRQGTLQALPIWAHSVHVRVAGLAPGTDYFYRFMANGALSPVGRTRTADDPASTRPVRFAVANCQRYEHGFYTAYRHLAAERPDVVIHVGDYIYESGEAADPVRPLGPVSGQAIRLHEYRLRYARYRTDPDLRAAHAAAPWVPTWDDHEVADNYRGRGDGSQAFLRRRAAAYQAYYENQPLRVRPRNGNLQMYRRRTYGVVADFMVLDVRQYRTAGTMLGAGQEQWLLSRLRTSPVRWRVLVQPLFFARRFVPGPAPNLRTDSWDGHPGQRARILAANAPGLVVLSGDVHNAWAGELKADFLDPASATVGVEFVGSSISSRPPRTDGPAVLAANPHLTFFDDRRGYLSGVMSPEELRVAYRAVDFVDEEGSPVRTVAEFVTMGSGLTSENTSSK